MSLTVTARVNRPRRYPVVGAVALDAMAATAGPAWAPGHDRAWSTAFDIVVAAMLAAAPPADRPEGGRASERGRP